ncbi:Diadenosine tetraphosphate (Ap4A) hydrolase [Desulfacinum hydrothermale DSM 13146]|uniref:Diadenosine tetraphosphate (Ap4A) hydrolase n=1 Tax=Desulfacinum hydrothermale DSM 13146 TaxID=1121390 RepID=A0A1W1XLS4_9BACT|nr:HIT domain-containing protein [Desulfacinum hydrothermale]SMC24929.1 Diadenosine tetraphosphate (Ap4A) hydrolase [Desulfacinum hydrothermale DSM 13146]
MRNLWAPWRMEYILGKREPYCIFCPEGDGLSDEERLILYRGHKTMVMMNKYPYNNGHLLVAPWRHVASVEDLTDEEMTDMMRMVRECVGILRQVMHPDGFNVGLNLGAAAGAGVESHMHFHVVPRWEGDTNFMTVFAEVRSIPEHIRQTYNKLLPYFKKEKIHEAV